MDMNYTMVANITVSMNQEEAEDVSYVLRQGLQAMYEAGETSEHVKDLTETLANWART